MRDDSSNHMTFSFCLGLGVGGVSIHCSTFLKKTASLGAGIQMCAPQLDSCVLHGEMFTRLYLKLFSLLAALTFALLAEAPWSCSGQVIYPFIPQTAIPISFQRLILMKLQKVFRKSLRSLVRSRKRTGN